jgi:hypothetical protein
MFNLSQSAAGVAELGVWITRKLLAARRLRAVRRGMSGMARFLPLTHATMIGGSSP